MEDIESADNKPRYTLFTDEIDNCGNTSIPNRILMIEVANLDDSMPRMIPCNSTGLDPITKHTSVLIEPQFNKTHKTYKIQYHNVIYVNYTKFKLTWLLNK